MPTKFYQLLLFRAASLRPRFDRFKTKLIFFFNSDHCMVDFVKPSLLGTEREFNNRFVAPITNGQYEDSTPYDVKLMKKRAHVLHEMLAGCVQV